jgi:hypothetical protein
MRSGLTEGVEAANQTIVDQQHVLNGLNADLEQAQDALTTANEAVNDKRVRSPRLGQLPALPDRGA